VLCEVSTSTETFDLSPLIKDSGHHLAVLDLPGGSTTSNEDAAGTFYINVCHPLNPIFNTLCPAGAAACREVSGSAPQSLGMALTQPVYNPDTKEVTLTYSHGQPCKGNPSVNASSVIVFRCKQGLEMVSCQD
jgi:insulin-like growth factor 2 receptor